MNKSILFLINLFSVFLLINSSNFKDINISVKCMFIDGFTLYDLSSMARSSGEDIKDFALDIDGTKYHYNFCYNIKKEHSCDVDKKQFAKDENGKCEILAKEIGTGNKWKISSEEEEKRIIEMDLNKEQDNKEVKFFIECDNSTEINEENRSKHTFEKFIKKSEGSKEIYEFYFKSAGACPKIDFYFFWKIIQEYDYIFAIVIMALSLFLCILGLKFIKPAVFILTIITIILVFTVFFLQFVLPAGTKTWVLFLIIGIGIIIGLFVGIFIIRTEKYSLPILFGGLSGFFLGNLLFNLFGNRINAKPLLVNILFCVACMIVLAILAFIFQKFLKIFTTSFIGSYGFIRGLSFWAGGFPNEFEIIDLMSKDEAEQIKELLTWKVYIYLASIVVILCLSIFIQYKLNGDKLDNEEELADGKDPFLKHKN